jgi:hypothetical protein
MVGELTVCGQDGLSQFELDGLLLVHDFPIWNLGVPELKMVSNGE